MCAASGEVRRINVTHKTSGRTKMYKNKTTFYGRGKAKDGGALAEINKTRDSPFTLDDFIIEEVQIPEPAPFVYSSIKRTLQKIVNTVNATDVVILLGEGKTFRDEIELPAKDKDCLEKSKYKGNRIGTARPVRLKEARQYLIDNYNTKIITGVEADDVVNHYAWEGHQKYLKTGYKEHNNIIVSTIDKDQYGCDGWLYNKDTMIEPLYIEGMGHIYLNSNNLIKGHGLLFKFSQLNGKDQADNYCATDIPSFKGKYGQVSLYNDLIECKTHKDLLELTIKNFKMFVPEPCTYLGCFGNQVTDDWKSWLNKMQTLVHMERFEGDRWDVLKECDEHGVVY